MGPLVNKWITWFISQLIQARQQVYILYNLKGQFALAFMIHNGVGPLMGTNKVKENNQRDLKISYTLASIIYGLTGVFGAFGLLVNIK